MSMSDETKNIVKDYIYEVSQTYVDPVDHSHEDRKYISLMARGHTFDNIVNNRHLVSKIVTNFVITKNGQKDEKSELLVEHVAEMYKTEYEKCVLMM